MARQPRPPDEQDIRLGESIHEARGRLGRTQTWLAKLTDCDRSFVSQVERGVRRPPRDWTWKAAAALDLRVEELLPPGSLSEEEAEALRLIRSAPPERRAQLIKTLSAAVDLLK